jgi:hypothetical protein
MHKNKTNKYKKFNLNFLDDNENDISDSIQKYKYIV